MKTPIYLSQSATEMGIACLRMTMATYGVHVGVEQLRLVIGVSRDGADLDALGRAAEKWGFTSLVLSTPMSAAGDLRDQQPCFPFIAQWKDGHTVVVIGRNTEGWEVIDPIYGRKRVSDSEVLEGFSDNSLYLQPSNQLLTSGKPRTMMKTLTENFAGSRQGVLYVVLAGLALVVPGILTPGMIRVFVDSYLTAGDRDSAGIIVFGLALALVLTVTLTALQIYALRRLTTITVARASARFVWHLMRMPAWFYAQRDATTLAFRISVTGKIAELMSGPFATAILAQVTSAFFLIIMFTLSPILGGVALLGYAIVIALLWRIGPVRLEVKQRQAREVAVTATHIGVSVRVLETLKATGSESVAFDRIFSSMGRHLSLGNTHLWAMLGMLPIFMSGLIGAMVLSVGAVLVINGVITQGTLAAFTILLAGFIAPLSALIPSIDEFFRARGAIETINDVLDQPVDTLLVDSYADKPHAVATVGTASPLQNEAPDESPDESLNESATFSMGERPVAQELDGSREGLDDLSAIVQQGRKRRTRMSVDPWAALIELHGVNFGYVLDGPALLSDISITIEPGRLVAIVGQSGSGKSTIGRLIAGLYQPWSGHISIDGRRLNDYPRAARAQEVGFVDQDTVIYRANVRENITMFDRDIADRDVIAAAKAALIHDDIIARPGGYEALLAEDGLNLSGGQRQRLGIARGLVRQPRLLILDEATSSLDARTEAHIVEKLRDQGCTSLVVAHRLSTVRDADEIIVLDHGVIVERGTHRQLAARDGLYRTLMDA